MKFDANANVPGGLNALFVAEALERLIREVLERIREEHLSAGRSARSIACMAILSDRLDMPIMSPLSDLFSDEMITFLLEKVETVLVSKQNIPLDESFDFHVTIIDGPDPDPRLLLLAGPWKKALPEVRQWKKKWKSATIMPEMNETEYEDCCLLLALALFWTRHYQNDPGVLRLAKIRNGGWSKKSLRLLKQCVDAFVEKFSIPVHLFRRCTLTRGVERVLDLAGLGLSIFDGATMHAIYKYPAGIVTDRPVARVVAIPVVEDEKSSARISHAALITRLDQTMPTLKTKGFECPYCYRSISKKYLYAHKCVVEQCKTCRRPVNNPQHFSDPDAAHTKCRPSNKAELPLCGRCRRPFHSKMCKKFHDKFCSRDNGFCEKCMRTYRRGTKEHVCGERFCRICKKYVASFRAEGSADKFDHHCVMTGPHIPKFQQPLAFFDMETKTDESGEHSVNAVGFSYERRKEPGSFDEIYFYDEDMQHPEDGVLHQCCFFQQYWNEDPASKPKHPTITKICKKNMAKTKVPQGSTALEKFVRYLLTEKFENYVLIGHNASRFDSILLLNTLLSAGFSVDPIFDGNKALQIRISALKIRIVDSYRYIKLPLAKFPNRFPTLSTLEGVSKKGVFPYRFNSPEHYDYCGEMPARDFYVDEFSPPSASAQFEQERMSWEGRRDWNFRNEIHKYLVQDVRVLRGGVVISCYEYFEFQKDLQSDSGPREYLNPFTKPFFTKNSFIHAIWRKFAMPRDAVFLTTNQRNAIKTSQGEREWLAFEQTKDENSDLRTAFNHPEGQAKVGRYRLDGLCGKTAFEFNGCLVHYHAAEFEKCPISKDFSPGHSNPFGVPLLTAHHNWNEKKKFLRRKGMTVNVKWECEFAEDKKKDPNLIRFLHNFYDDRSPKERMRLRSGLRGGRVESFRLRFLQESNPHHRLYYIDKNSLYPAMAIEHSYPVGPPECFVGERLAKVTFDPERGGFFCQESGSRLEGVIQATVLPPDSMFLPILPVQSGGKLKFGLCRTCLKEMRKGYCNHADAQRELLGTWTTPEIVYAVSCGYKLVKVWELYAYRKQEFVFRTFYTRLARMKLESEGFPENVAGCSAKEEAYVNDLNARFPGLGLLKENVSHNQPRRNFAKEVSNCGLGKFSQNDMKSNFKYATCYQDLYRLVFDSPNINVKYANPIHDNLVEVAFEPKDETLGVHRNTQTVIYSFVTAYARISMMRDMRKLMQMGARLYYTDTDSIIFDWPEDGDREAMEREFRMGEKAYGAYKYETDSCIVNFVTLGAKNYAFVTLKGSHETKVRGFVLAGEAASGVVNYSSMSLLLEKFVRGIKDSVSARHFTMRIDRKQCKVKNMEMVKKYSNDVYDKRFVPDGIGDDNFTTYPFGLKNDDFSDV